MIRLLRPVSDPVSQKFGANPASYKWWGFPGHEGLDFASSIGTPVKAAADGKVIKAVWDKSEDSRPYGRQVRIMSTIDGKQVETAYAHLSQSLVRVGQQVKAGDVIGRTGMSGSNGNEPHLHFLVKIAGMQTPGYPAGVVDPEHYIVDILVNPQPKPTTEDGPTTGVQMPADGSSCVDVRVVDQSNTSPAPILFNQLKQKTIFVDVSRYDPDFDPAIMADYGVTGVVVKSTGGGGYVDPKCRDHCARVRAAGLLLGLYPWLDPTFDGKTQAEDAARLNDEIKPDFVMIDNEQEHASWDAFYAYRNGKLTWAQVPRLTYKQVQRVTVDFGDRAQQLWGRDIPTWNYSFLGYFQTYLKDIIPYLEEHYKTVLAYYRRGSGNVKTTWDNFMKIEFNTWKFPTLPKGMAEPIGLQGTGDRYVLPGSSSKMDVIAMNGNLEGVLKHMNRKSLPAVTPLPYDRVKLKDDCFGLNVRALPNSEKTTRVLRVALRTETLRLSKTEISGPWRRLWGEPGWIHGGFVTALSK